jgi:cell division protein FtsI/penicillin-binding protein 2
MPARGNTTWRLLFLALVLAVSAAGLVVRLVQLQVIEHGRYAREAFEEHYAERQIYATRGPILDRNGHPLALSVDAWDVYVNRHAWEDAGAGASAAASSLAPMLGLDDSILLSEVLGDRNGEVLMAEAVPYELGQEIEEAAITGVRLEPTSQRTYPEGPIASAVLGFLGKDRVGLTGLEQVHNEALAGNPGRTIYEQDSLGNEIAVGELLVQSPQPGGAVVLTIDRGVQRASERALDDAIQHYQARGGSIIVMDPSTGEILAMTSRPSIDVTALDFSDANLNDLSRLRAVSDLYEPGSTFKLITLAAALDRQVVSPGTTYFDDGQYTWSDKTILNWDRSVNGTQTMTEVLQKSLNTGAIWVAETLGEDAFYSYLSGFGFDAATGVDFPGEAVGRYRVPGDPEWSRLDLATNSFGQGINVTPIEMISALAAIANGGELMRPYLVEEVRGVSGIARTEPQVVRRVISEEAARTLRAMMVEVVEGIAVPTGIPGYEIAGKTGTSSIYEMELEDYNPQRVIVSFAGIVPAENPRFVVLVKIDEPSGVAYGSTVAAPVFHELAIEIVNLLNVPPEPRLVREVE